MGGYYILWTLSKALSTDRIHILFYSISNSCFCNDYKKFRPKFGLSILEELLLSYVQNTKSSVISTCSISICILLHFSSATFINHKTSLFQCCWILCLWSRKGNYIRCLINKSLIIPLSSLWRHSVSLNFEINESFTKTHRKLIVPWNAVQQPK